MLAMDLQNIMMLAALVFFVYAAYKVGAFVLKIGIGVLVFYLISVILGETWPWLRGWIN
jgi:hypothetical protein